MKSLKITLGIAGTLIIGAMLVLWFRVYGEPHKGRFSLANNAKEVIANASVQICEQTIEFKNIQPAAIRSGTYEPACEGHYIIQVEFSSGKRLQNETGYATRGIDFSHEIIVTDLDVEIVKSKTD